MGGTGVSVGGTGVLVGKGVAVGIDTTGVGCDAAGTPPLHAEARTANSAKSVNRLMLNFMFLLSLGCADSTRDWNVSQAPIDWIVSGTSSAWKLSAWALEFDKDL